VNEWIKKIWFTKWDFIHLLKLYPIICSKTDGTEGNYVK
jgi:hypothetical protein